MKTQLLCIAIFLVCFTVTQGDEHKVEEKQNDDDVDHKTLDVSDHIAKPDDQPKAEQTKPSTQPPLNSSVKHDSNLKTTTSKSPANVTVSKDAKEGTSVSDSMFDATKRAVYLLTGACVVVLLYFLWKSYRIKQRQTHIHKYGVVASREDLEMTSLGFGSEDEEDDTTHFDIGKHQRS